MGVNRTAIYKEFRIIYSAYMSIQKQWVNKYEIVIRNYTVNHYSYSIIQIIMVLNNFYLKNLLFVIYLVAMNN